MKKLTILSITMLIVLTKSTNAAVIDWGLGPVNISGTNDVSLTGTLVDAFTLGPTGVQTVSVNGVTFAAFAFPNNFTTDTTTLGNYTFVESSGTLVSYNTLGSGAAPFSNLALEYRTLLSSGGSASLPNTLTLTISGLTINQEYLFQFWVNNSVPDTTTPNGFGFSTTASAENSVTLDENTTGVNGGLGQFVIGSFIADGTEQTIDFNGLGNDDPLVNAFQIRAIPEPTTTGMAVVGGVLLLLARRRKTA